MCTKDAGSAGAIPPKFPIHAGFLPDGPAKDMGSLAAAPSATARSAVPAAAGAA